MQISINAQIIADLVITNANVHTMDVKNPYADTIVVTGGRISAVGKKSEMAMTIGNKTDVIDAGGKLIVPGFNDAHVHFTTMGSQFFSIDLRDAKTPQEIVEKIKFSVQFLPKGQWVLGGGWNNSNWISGSLPTKHLIDSATPDNPVFIYHSKTKIALVNSLALRLARIDKNTKDIAGGEIMRDAAGEPSGILKDSAINLVKKLVPPFATDDKLAVAETASNYAAAFGVTSVQDMSADDNTEIYRELARRGKLKTRIYDCAGLSGWQKLAKNNIKKSSGDAMIRRGCLKGIADGETESTPKLYEEILAADRAGLQVMVHAIGARANDQILTIFERVVKANGKKDRRFRAEHAHGFRPPDFRRFANSVIIASVQPFLFSNDAGKSIDPLRTLLANNATLAFGSDSSLIPVNPLFGIAAAVNANDPKQKLTVEEAVRFYTAGSAFAEFQENEKGTIAVGKLADLVILSDDIFTIDPNKIRETKVLKTIMNGNIVYQAN
ncbi:MAG TPA: amidohydrolase [Pyrinomonadaceae bacterium]|nr:amidohydrolase [Pyrinomonadaceae bacterium]